jgi:nicotinamidase-related amidase
VQAKATRPAIWPKVRRPAAPEVAGVKRWNLDPKLTSESAALLLFDVLQGYLHPSDPAKAAALEAAGTAANLARLLAGARETGLRVFYAAGDHAADGSDTAQRLTDTDYDLRPWSTEHPQTFRQRFSHGDREAQVAGDLAPRDGEDILISKHRWSAFFQTSLELALRTRGIDTIVLAGLSTDVGIAATAFAARDLDFGLVIARDACFSARGPNNDFFMDRIFPRMGRVMTVDYAIGLMK